MEIPSNFDLRQFRQVLVAVHDAVSFGLRLQGDCGIEFRWEICGYDCDPDLSYAVKLEVHVHDPRIDRLALTDAVDGSTLSETDVKRVNERLKPFGIAIERSTVDEIVNGGGEHPVAVTRVRIDFSVGDIPADGCPADPDDSSTPF